jgi:hypothetical protein
LEYSNTGTENKDAGVNTLEIFGTARLIKFQLSNSLEGETQRERERERERGRGGGPKSHQPIPGGKWVSKASRHGSWCHKFQMYYHVQRQSLGAEIFFGCPSS